MSDNDGKKEVLFDLCDEALYVANSGRAFTRKGVIGICASHLSEKTGIRSDDYECEDKDLTSCIREREITTYQNDRNRVESDAHGEQEISHDYDGRFAWELLQNADDVMGSTGRQPAELIGTKGLGFKSVLEITEEPEIHSGLFNFKFSPNETQKLLKCKNIHENPPRLTFRIPHFCKPTGKVRKLLDMGYSTVIRLPFQDEEAQEKARNTLKSLKPHFLLLSQQIENVRIIQDGEERVFSIRRDAQGLSDGRVVLEGTGGQTEWQRWVATQNIAEAKRITVAVAIPLNGNGEAVSYTDELPFHVFFPTEEQLGIKALVHASFDLEQNRKHLRNGNYDEEILDHFGDILKRVILDIPPRTVLEVFGVISQSAEDNDKPIEKIKRAICQTVRSTCFVPVLGGKRVSPTVCKCWEDKLGEVVQSDSQEVQKANLIVPVLSSLSDVLKKLGASEIDNSQFVHLLRYCHNKSFNDCISSFQVLADGGLKRAKTDKDEETLSLLRQVPCWWTEDGKARQLQAMPALLWEKPDEWPDWLAVNSLHSEFQTEIEKWENQHKETVDQSHTSRIKKWESFIEHFLSRKKEHYIDWVLLPVIKSWEQRDWEKQGFDVLKWLMRWENKHEFDKTSPCIRGEESRRNRLAATLRLPTDKGWLPAIDCFAAKSWNGPEAFDTFYRGRKGRGIIRSFEKWPNDLPKTDKVKWKSLLRWAGVSWEPKVCQTQDFKIPAHQLWSGYYSKFDYITLAGGHNYQIDDFPDCLAGIENTELIRDILPALFKSAEERAQRHYKLPSGYKHYHQSPQAFAFEQLRIEAWLPVNQSLLENGSRIPPNEAFLPGKGLNGLLPEVDKSGIDEDIWHGRDGIKAKLIELGVMENLPESSEKWYEWMQKLADKGRTLDEKDREAPADWKDSGSKDLWRAAHSLYSEYLKKRISGPFPKDIQIPCICFENSHRILDFAQPEQVHWIDESHLVDLTLENELLSKGYKLFIFRLQQSDEIKQLGVRKLSSVIESKPDYKPRTDEKNELDQRYSNRRIVLNKVMNIQLPEEVDIKAVTDLTLELSTNGKELGKCSVLSWKEAAADAILVDTKNKWRALAHALAHRLNGKYAVYANDFEVYLSDESDESVLDRARNAGIPEEAFEEVKESISSLNGSPVESENVRNEDQGIENTGDVESSKPSDTKGVTNGSNVGGNSGEIGTDVRDRPDGTGAPVGNGKTRTSDPRPETGLDAEKWLGEQLQSVFHNRRKKVHEGSDFIIESDGQQIHVEAKHVETRPGSIHWSRRQYETCQENNPYFIALLSSGQSDIQYAIHWIWNPLKELINLERNVTWTGKSEPKSIPKGGWAMEDLKRDLPDLQPYTFIIEVRLTDDLFGLANKDDPMLKKLEGKLENLRSSSN